MTTQSELPIHVVVLDAFGLSLELVLHELIVQQSCNGNLKILMKLVNRFVYMYNILHALCNLQLSYLEELVGPSLILVVSIHFT